MCKGKLYFEWFSGKKSKKFNIGVIFIRSRTFTLNNIVREKNVCSKQEKNST